MEYQIRCLEYTDPGMRSDMKRMLRSVPQGRRWLKPVTIAAHVDLQPVLSVLGYGLHRHGWLGFGPRRRSGK